jgi:hypothetical protein
MNPRTHSCSHPSASRLTVRVLFESRSLQDQQMMANDKSSATTMNKKQLSRRQKNKSVRIASSSRWNHGSESNAPMKPSRRNSVDDNPLWGFRCDNVHDHPRPTMTSILKSSSSFDSYDSTVSIRSIINQMRHQRGKSCSPVQHRGQARTPFDRHVLVVLG